MTLQVFDYFASVSQNGSRYAVTIAGGNMCPLLSISLQGCVLQP